MNDQERQVIDDIFQRLEQVANQPRDPEAERYIADKLRRQPYAPYALAQAVFVQEQALANLQADNERLRAEFDRMSRQPPQQQGGFLSSIFGGGASRPPEPAYNAPPSRQASPWGQPQPQPMPQQPYGAPQSGPMGGATGPWGGAMQRGGGGGFLGSALTTAAGVAGGMMIANALSHAFSGNNNPLGEASSLAGLGGADQAADNAGFGNITDALYPDQKQDPQEDDQDFSDFGGDGGDEGDWT
ncbi:DUF2076 domain-containing protein [Microvirga lotononidis]|uniref:Periplasmic ligand-binding sensor protein n=1 Tax=Microvirga lotononidis TaxID=864069 RepID=I4YUZ3_9HYPH|nr:DUF2076 domain-containing protein [Microvirga lotononidis]EIM27785.1 hypothetical protein MicloDRAFT_00043590 [Microvirga lotononidis]WQO28082.1 DUF2076 domain-containing protein [Microvirga lotononidis]